MIRKIALFNEKAKVNKFVMFDVATTKYSDLLVIARGYAKETNNTVTINIEISDDYECAKGYMVMVHTDGSVSVTTSYFNHYQSHYNLSRKKYSPCPISYFSKKWF